MNSMQRILSIMLLVDLSSSFSTSRMYLTSLHKTSMELKVESEDEQLSLMFKARECAHSEACSVEEADQFLHEVMTFQGSCGEGILLGDADVCEDPVFINEVILDLKEKISDAQGSSREIISKTSVFMQTDGNGAIATAKPMIMALAAIYLATKAISLSHPEAMSFTSEEWWWAIRDGYLNGMLVSYMKTGRLSALDPAVPFTSEEWFWAAKDGYLNDMLSHYFRNGGL